MRTGPKKNNRVADARSGYGTVGSMTSQITQEYLCTSNCVKGEIVSARVLSRFLCSRKSCLGSNFRYTLEKGSTLWCQKILLWSTQWQNLGRRIYGHGGKLCGGFGSITVGTKPLNLYRGTRPTKLTERVLELIEQKNAEWRWNYSERAYFVDGCKWAKPRVTHGTILNQHNLDVL